jgi:hypothetical protein
MYFFIQETKKRFQNINPKQLTHFLITFSVNVLARYILNRDSRQCKMDAGNWNGMGREIWDGQIKYEMELMMQLMSLQHN